MNKIQKLLASAVIAGVIPACGIFIALPEDTPITARIWGVIVATVLLNAAKDLQSYLTDKPE